MKNMFILMVLIICFLSCKKKSTEPPNNNEMKATVILSSGDTVNINAKGSKALMGCGSYGIGTYVNGTNENNAAVYIDAFDTNLRCITSPGTYVLSCEYRVNVTDQNTPIFGNSGGSITFTAINEHYMEGYFSAVCKCISSGCAFLVDSVIVTGTFKGDHLN